MIWLLVGYMWLFIHRPFEVWPWIGAYHVERVFMLFVLTCWAFAARKTWTSCRSNVPVFLLAGTFLLAVGISPYATFQYVETWFKLLVFYILLITSVRTEKDLKTLVIAYVCVIGLYELHSLREFLCGRYVYRMGTARMVGVDVAQGDPNYFGASVVYALPFLYPVWTFAERGWHKIAVVGGFTLGVTCVLLTGSRSSFAGLLLIVLAGVLASKYRWRMLVPAIIAVPIIWANLRGDLQDRYMTMIDPSRGTAGAQGSAEGRTASFWYGMNSFAENPLLGAGIGSYRAKTGIATHNVYNQAMGEMGVFGLAVLVGFAWAYFATLLEARRLRGDPHDLDELFLYRVCLAAAGSCLLLFLLGWGGHNLMRYNWLWFGAFAGIALTLLRQRAHQQLLVDNDMAANPPGPVDLELGESLNTEWELEEGASLG